MSTPRSSSKSGGPYRKPRADIYTVMLLIALVALIIGITFLVLEMDTYDWRFKGGPRVTVLDQSTATLACTSTSARVPTIARREHNTIAGGNTISPFFIPDSDQARPVIRRARCLVVLRKISLVSV